MPWDLSRSPSTEARQRYFRAFRSLRSGYAHPLPSRLESVATGNFAVVPKGGHAVDARLPSGENPGQNGGEEDTTDERGERMRETDPGTRSLRRPARRVARRASESREGQNPSS
jgi:hypothetical protein